LLSSIQALRSKLEWYKLMAFLHLIAHASYNFVDWISCLRRHFFDRQCTCLQIVGYLQKLWSTATASHLPCLSSLSLLSIRAERIVVSAIKWWYCRGPSGRPSTFRHTYEATVMIVVWCGGPLCDTSYCRLWWLARRSVRRPRRDFRPWRTSPRPVCCQLLSTMQSVRPPRWQSEPSDWRLN